MEGTSPPSIEMCTIDHKDGFSLVPPKDVAKLVKSNMPSSAGSLP
jgi:hypothetical protein